MNNIVYELNTATMSYSQVEFESDSDKTTHTSNRDTHQKLLSRRTIGICNKYISIFSPLMDTKIGANNHPAFLVSTGVLQAPQALQSPSVQEIISDAAADKMGTNRTLQPVIRTGMGVTDPDLRGVEGV